MNPNEFIEQYKTIVGPALKCAEKARREGLLALEEELDHEKAGKRDIFNYGLLFVIDGYDREIIDKILTNIIAQETDGQMKTLKTIQKEAVLMIQEGMNHRLLYAVLNSYTGFPLEEELLEG